jgi:hypothetical protein
LPPNIARLLLKQLRSTWPCLGNEVSSCHAYNSCLQFAVNFVKPNVISSRESPVKSCQTENHLPEIDCGGDLVLTLIQYKSKVTEMLHRSPTNGSDEVRGPGMIRVCIGPQGDRVQGFARYASR